MMIIMLIIIHITIIQILLCSSEGLEGGPRREQAMAPAHPAAQLTISGASRGCGRLFIGSVLLLLCLSPSLAFSLSLSLSLSKRSRKALRSMIIWFVPLGIAICTVAVAFPPGARPGVAFSHRANK